MIKMSVIKNASYLLLIFSVAMQSCGLFGGGYDDGGELVGVPGREGWEMTRPYGMAAIPAGTFHMGQADEDVAATQPGVEEAMAQQKVTPVGVLQEVGRDVVRKPHQATSLDKEECLVI